MLQYGKITVCESYSEGKKTKTETIYSIPIKIIDKSHLLGEIIKAIEMIEMKKTHQVTLTISDDKEFNIKLLRSEYTIWTQNHKISQMF